MESITDWLGGFTRYIYDNVGNLIWITNANLTTVAHTYDRANRLVAQTNAQPDGTVISSYSLTLDGLGNLQRSIQYERLEPLLEPGTSTYSYDANNRLTNINGGMLQYDAQGSLVHWGGNYFDYDGEDRLTQHLLEGHGISPLIIKYSYDGLGNRLERRNNGVTNRFVYDHASSLNHLLAETDSDGNIIAYYVHGFGLISRITANGSVAYYHYDPRGNSISLTDANGEITDNYAYDTFGQLVNKSGPSSNSFRFLGRYGICDDGNGLLYIRARYYQPSFGRFLTKDPITGRDSDGQSLNRYVYALNNPLLFADITGLSPRELGTSFGPDNIHLLLDLCGFYPGYGAICDVANAGLFLFERDFKNAGLSAFAAVPGVGDLGAGIIKASKGARHIAKAVNSADERFDAIRRILLPDGKPIGTAFHGDVRNRDLPGGVEEARSLFNKISVGGRIVKGGKDYKGILVKLPDGGFVGLRTFATQSRVAATIDVNIPDFPIERIKFK